MKNPFLFDSYALLAFFQNEQGSTIVRDVLKNATQNKEQRLINVINLGEIIYLTLRRFGDQKKMEVLSRIHQIGFTILSAPDELVFQAAELKAVYSISFADCFALASAIQHSATILTGDPEFRMVEHLATIKWIR